MSVAIFTFQLKNKIGILRNDSVVYTQYISNTASLALGDPNVSVNARVLRGADGRKPITVGNYSCKGF